MYTKITNNQKYICTCVFMYIYIYRERERRDGNFNARGFLPLDPSVSAPEG